jgi:tetratricopeptide (TPR) repeat protein
VRRALAATLAVATALPLGTAAATPEDEAARHHFEIGRRKYNLGDLDEAILEFKHAYELSPAPGLLFNIAQAYRAKKDNERALYFYATYLREDPQAPERAYVEARMEELRAAPSDQRAAPDMPRRDEDPGHDLRIAGLVVGGGGLALAGTAVFFGFRAMSASDEISGVFARHETWTQHDAEVYADGQRSQTAAWVLGAAGVTALATGGLLYYMGARERRVSVGPVVGGGGAGVTMRCAF